MQRPAAQFSAPYAVATVAQMLSLENQTLMIRTDQHRDADSSRTGSGHHQRVSTPAFCENRAYPALTGIRTR